MEVEEPKQSSGESVAPENTTEPKDKLALGQPLTVPHVPPPPTNPPQPPAASQDNTPPWKKIVEIAAVVVAAGLLIINIFQMCATQKAADAAKISADTSVAASRAWIVPAEQIQSMQTLGSINLTWKNVGPTPAVQISATADYTLTMPYKRPKTCAQLKASTWKDETAILTTNAPPFQMTLQNIPVEWTNPMRDTISVLRAYGCVWYTDVLTSRERTTEFCYQAMRFKLDAPAFQRPDIKGKAPEVVVQPCLMSDPFVFN